MKKWIAIVLIALSLLSMVGCGAKEVDATAMTDALVNDLTFDAPMSVTDITYYLDVPEGAKAFGYMSNGTTAEEVFVVECLSDDDASAVMDSMVAYLEEQTQEMSRYIPEEVTRLGGAVLRQEGKVVVLCVCADGEAAQKIVKEYMG